MRVVIGISEGIVLADRYRLVRRQVERGIGATWIAADIETGADVWVQFADQGGLADAAELLRRHEAEHRAIPAVLDTGELRLIVDSQAVTVSDGRPAPRATHVEIVIEFVVLKPLTGRALPSKITRRALPPAEALTLVAGIAGALGPARAEGCSHGWLTADSVWAARRGGYVIDMALGLAFPDSARIEVGQQATGYFAPERLAGDGASEAADVFALGWLLYEALIGHAALQAEYAKLVAGAGAVTTVELLALWRERARLHLVEILDANSPLALLLTACLAEQPADRPGLGAFASGARDTAVGWAGVGALVEFSARPRTAAGAAVAAAEATVAVAAEMDAATADAEVGMTHSSAVSDEVAAALVVNSALGLDATAAALDEAAMLSEGETETETGTNGSAGTAGTSAGAAEAATGLGEAVRAAETVEAAQAVGVAAAVMASETPRHGRHRPMLAFTAVGSIAAIFIIGLVVGYEWGHSGGSSSSATAFVGVASSTPSAAPGKGSGGGSGSSGAVSSGATGSVVVAEASASAACATPAAASASASASPTASAATSPLVQLHQIVLAAESSGGITSSTASQLTAAITTAQAASTGSTAWNSALSHLSTLIQSGQQQGTIPTGTADELATVLSDLYGASGS